MQELPQPGNEPVPPPFEARSLNHWTTREVKRCFLNQKKKKVTSLGNDSKTLKLIFKKGQRVNHPGSLE